MNSIPPFLDINKLTTIYYSSSGQQNVVLNRLSLSAQQGEYIALVGDNACGKSTLFNSICNVVKPISGSIMLDGKQILGLSEWKISNTVGRVWQNSHNSLALSFTVYDNLALALSKGQKGLFSIAFSNKVRQTVVASLMQCRMGLENKIDMKVSSLSGGERQAVALLMAIICKPKLLLLDEHTAALDQKNKMIILRLTEQIIRRHQITTIMITHNRRDAQQCDRTITIKNGSIVPLKNIKEELPNGCKGG